MKLEFADKSILPIFESLNYDAGEMQELMVAVANNDLDENYSKKEAEEAIRKTMFALLELKPEQVNIAKYYNRAWKRNHTRVFEVIEDVIPAAIGAGWNNDPFFNEFVEVKNGADGDLNEFWTEDDTQLVVSKVSGGHHDLTVQRLGYGRSFSTSVASYAVRVGTDFRSYLRGDVDWAKLVNAVAKAFDQKIKAMCYTQMAGIGSSLPAQAMFNKTTGWATSGAKELIEQLIDDVNAANGGNGVIVMALESDLRKLTALLDASWLSGRAKDDYYENARVSRFGSAALVGIPQQLSKVGDTVTRLISAGHLYVLPRTMDKPIKVFNEGAPDIYQVTTDGARLDDTVVYDYTQRFGVSAVVGTVFGHVAIS